MNDEVSVAELLEREGWTEQERKPRSRMQVVAVMMAVILGCGLAAILVKVGADTQPDDQAAIFSLPHGPTGGLAGGGLPEQNSSERTNSSTHVVVTNESAGAEDGDDGIPWQTKSRTHTSTATVTVTDSGDPPTSGTETGTPADPGQTGTTPSGGHTTNPTTTTPTRPAPTCVLWIICRP